MIHTRHYLLEVCLIGIMAIYVEETDLIKLSVLCPGRSLKEGSLFPTLPENFPLPDSCHTHLQYPDHACIIIEYLDSVSFYAN